KRAYPSRVRVQHFARVTALDALSAKVGMTEAMISCVPSALEGASTRWPMGEELVGRMDRRCGGCGLRGTRRTDERGIGGRRALRALVTVTRAAASATRL